MTRKHTFGPYLRAKRLEQGVSLRKLALGLGISAVYLGEIERGIKGALPRGYWEKLYELLPKIDRTRLEQHAAESTALQLDLQDAPPQYQNLGHALARRVERQDLSERDLTLLLDILDADRNGNRQ